MLLMDKHLSENFIIMERFNYLLFVGRFHFGDIGPLSHEVRV